MTTVDNDQQQAVDRLLALSPEDFRNIVEENMGDEHPQLWEALLDPRVVRRTHATLAATHQDVLSQLAQKSSEMSALSGEQWRAANKEHADWRRRALGYQRMVMRRKSEAKYALGSAVAPPRQGMEPTKKVRLMSTVFELGRAIREHQQRCDELGITAEQHDLDLWDALEDVEVQTDGGLVTVAEFMAQARERDES